MLVALSNYYGAKEIVGMFGFDFLNVSNFRKQIFLFSFEQKNERNIFLISALRI
jgi:hypothetical protein